MTRLILKPNNSTVLFLHFPSVHIVLYGVCVQTLDFQEGYLL